MDSFERWMEVSDATARARPPLRCCRSQHERHLEATLDTTWADELTLEERAILDALLEFDDDLALGETEVITAGCVNRCRT